MSGFQSISSELRRGILQIALAESPEAAKQAFVFLKIAVERAFAACSSASQKDSILVAALIAEARQALIIGEELTNEKCKEEEEKQAVRRKFSLMMRSNNKSSGINNTNNPKP